MIGRDLPKAFVAPGMRPQECVCPRGYGRIWFRARVGPNRTEQIPVPQPDRMRGAHWRYMCEAVTNGYSLRSLPRRDISMICLRNKCDLGLLEWNRERRLAAATFDGLDCAS